MGLIFSLENANAVGYLIEGNVLTFLDESTKSNEMKVPNIEFIDKLVRNTQEDFYTSETFWSGLYPDIQRLREDWEEARTDFTDLRTGVNKNIEEGTPTYSRRLLFFLKDLSNILLRCKVKTLLLPGFQNSKLNELMYERHFLREFDLLPKN